MTEVRLIAVEGIGEVSPGDDLVAVVLSGTPRPEPGDVVITDTLGRAWRRGHADHAIGVSGLPAIVDLKGTHDHNGKELLVTEMAVADEIAGAAELVMGKANKVPVALVRGTGLVPGQGKAADLI